MNTLNSQLSALNFFRTLGFLCFLALGLHESQAQPEFNAPSGAEFAYGDPPRTMQITGIRSGQTSQDYVARDAGGFLTLEQKPNFSAWSWSTETPGSVTDFEASFDVKVTAFELQNPLSAIIPGLPPLLGPWDGDGWAFVYGSPSQFDAWTKSGSMEDGNEMTLAAGMDMLRTDTLFIKQNNGSPTTQAHSLGNAKSYRATIKVSGNTFSFTIDGTTVTKTLANYKPESGWVFAIGARNGAEYGKYEFSNGPMHIFPLTARNCALGRIDHTSGCVEGKVVHSPIQQLERPRPDSSRPT